jgi:hypothetical protein
MMIGVRSTNLGFGYRLTLPSSRIEEGNTKLIRRMEGRNQWHIGM